MHNTPPARGLARFDYFAQLSMSANCIRLTAIAFCAACWAAIAIVVF